MPLPPGRWGGRTLVPLGYEALAVAGVAVAPASLLADAAWIKVENGPIRFNVDGSVPTAALGYPAFDGDSFVLNQAELANFLAIRSGVTNATIHITRANFG